MAELPCKNKYEKMNQAIEIYEDCFDEVDSSQYLLSAGGALAVVNCAYAVAGATPEKINALIRCKAGATIAVTGFFSWLSKIDKCNALVFDAYSIGKDFEKCAAEHKDVLNAAAAANAANS